jgi:hypothetical protein
LDLAEKITELTWGIGKIREEREQMSLEEKSKLNEEIVLYDF